MKRASLFFIAVFGLIAVTHAQTNLIENQTNWPLGGTNNIFVGQQNLPKNSAWYTGTKAVVQGIPNGNTTNLVASVSGGSSLTFWTYFAPVGITNNSAPTNSDGTSFSLTNKTSMPVQLSPGTTIQVSVGFFVVNSAAQNTGRGLRIGLFYAGTNANVSGSGNGSSIGITGYGQNMNFGTSFGIAPLQTIAATNSQTAGSQLASTSVMDTIGKNGGGTTNDPGFIDYTNYTLVLSVTENSPTNVSITTTFLGSTFSNGASITQTVTDTNYCYTNFDQFIMRPGSGAQTALSFNLTSFQVLTYTNATGPIINTNPPVITSSVAGGNLTLSWPLDHTGWTLQSQTDSLNTGLNANWITVVGSTATNRVIVPVNPANGAVFYRLMYQ
ncbi:MAG TPA: hypothetical protein VGO57_00435 [Verrucomicrobiae bacterium]|jgi:hypothetical protein